MDVIEKNMPWLDGDYRDPVNEKLPFPDPKGRAIASELISNWGRADRVALLRGMMENWGKAALFSTLDMIGQFHAEKYWRSVARKQGDDSFEAFKKAHWDSLVPPDFEKSSEVEGKEVRFRVTRCLHARAAHELGMAELFYHLVCVTDPSAIKGFNPGIGFERSTTLMEGADCCDHSYILG
jgi:hypothetical protein